jgi:uncharacterized protein
VDIGVHQDGLVHISQLSDQFVKEPAEVVKVHQKVMVTVLEVDLARKRISLSMKKNPEKSGEPAPRTKSEDRSGKPGKPRPRFEPSAPKTGGWFSSALEQAKKKGK